MVTSTAERTLTAPALAAPARANPGLSLRPATVVRAALLLLVVGNLGRVPISVTAANQAPILFNDLLVAVILLSGLLAGLRAGAWRLDGPALSVLAFAAVGAGSALLAVPRFALSGIELVYSLAYLARWLAYFGVYLVAINTLREGDVAPTWRALETAILVFALFGIVQSLLLPGFAQLVQPEAGWDVQGHRLVSTFLDPNIAGALIDIGLLVTLARISAGVAVPAWKPVLLATALAMTLSRGSIVAVAAGALLILAARGLSRRLLRVAGALALLALPFVPLLVRFAGTFNKFDIGASALSKVPYWLRAIRVFLDHPVIGVGFNTYGFVQRSYGWQAEGVQRFGVDGGLLFIAVMTGLVGLAFYAGAIWLVLRRCRGIWRDRSRAAPDRGLAIGVAAATVAVVVHSVFANSLAVPFILEALWVLWALTFVIARPSRAAAPPPPPPAWARRGGTGPRARLGRGLSGDATALPSLLVDARLLGASGIGRYLREILARVLRDPPFEHIRLLGDPVELRAFTERHPSPARVAVVPHRGRVYSIRSQASWELLRLVGKTAHAVAFFPHWDAPFLLPERRSVVTVHDIVHFRVPDAFPPLLRLAAGALFRRVVTRAARIIAVSEWTKQDLMEFEPRTRGKVRVVLNGVSPAFGPPGAHEAPRPPVREPFLLCVGNKKRHKNLAAAIEVLVALLPHYPQLQLVVAGQAAAGWNDLLETAREKGVRGAVVDLPVLTDDELRVLYGSCAAFLFPSRYEGFGIPVLEAMACGAPVVASNASSIPEVAGAAALLFDPGDVAGMAAAVSRLMTDPSFRATRARLGRERASAFSWERTARQTVEILQDVAAG